MKIRILIIRTLIVPWLIPAIWLVLWPLAMLLVGVKLGTGDVKFLTRAIWNGMPR